MSKTNERNQEASYWKAHVRSFKIEGENNKRAYCRKHKLTYHQFLYWCDKIEYEGKQVKQGEALSEWVQVKHRETQVERSYTQESSSSLCTIEFKSGATIKLTSENSLRCLPQLVEALA